MIDSESLVKISISVTREIAKSKSLQFESLPSDVRKIVCKGKGKQNRDLNDIVSVLKYTDFIEMMPIFVVWNLDLLPPITFHQLDVSKLLKDLVLVQQKIKASNAMIHQLENIKKEIMDMTYSSLPNSMCVNIKWGANRESRLTGPALLIDTILSDDEVQHKSHEKQIIPSEKSVTNKKHIEGRINSFMITQQSSYSALPAPASKSVMWPALMIEPVKQLNGHVSYNVHISKLYSTPAGKMAVSTKWNQVNWNAEDNGTLVSKGNQN